MGLYGKTAEDDTLGDCSGCVGGRTPGEGFGRHVAKDTRPGCEPASPPPQIGCGVAPIAGSQNLRVLVEEYDRVEASGEPFVEHSSEGRPTRIVLGKTIQGRPVGHHHRRLPTSHPPPGGRAQAEPKLNGVDKGMEPFEYPHERAGGARSGTEARSSALGRAATRHAPVQVDAGNPVPGIYKM